MNYETEQCGAGKGKKKNVEVASTKQLNSSSVSTKKIQTLYGSSSSIQGIERIINQFYYSDEYKVDPKTLKIDHPTIDVNSRVGVIQKSGRYRFGSLL